MEFASGVGCHPRPPPWVGVRPEVKKAVDLLQPSQTRARVWFSPTAKVWLGSSHRCSLGFFLSEDRLLE